MVELCEDPKNLIFIQSRVETNQDLVVEYADMMQSGIQFEAAQGIRDTTSQVFIWDGLHRAEAARMTGMLLRIHVQPGTRQDAEWLALSTNQKHGLRRSRQDKQRVVQQALLHPFGAQLSDREIARHCGVDHKTVGKIRKELETTGEIPQLPKRVVTKANGETYHIDTTNIGNGKKTSTPVSKTDCWPDSIKDQAPNNGLYSQPLSEPQIESYPTPQEFECPRCGEEKIVGVNGSQRWCLNCLAEWPTSDTFLAEVNTTQQVIELPTRQHLQNRFLHLLSQLDEKDARLSRINAWLDTLEAQLDLAQAADDPDKIILSITSMQVSEYA